MVLVAVVVVAVVLFVDEAMLSARNVSCADRASLFWLTSGTDAAVEVDVVDVAVPGVIFSLNAVTADNIPAVPPKDDHFSLMSPAA